MRCTWTDKSRASFFQTSHRSRYLVCNGLIDPPSEKTPLYAIQFVTERKYLVYITSSESLIVLANTSTFFLTKTSEMKECIGLWPTNKRSPNGPDLKLRINITSYIWENDISEQADAMTRFKVSSIKNLYEEIVRRCKPENGPENLVSTFTAQGFDQIIPRPSITDIDVALEVSLAHSKHSDSPDIDESVRKRKASRLEGGDDSANPPTRRESPLKKARTGRKGGSARGRSGTLSNLVQQSSSDMGGLQSINQLIGAMTTSEAGHRPALHSTLQEIATPTNYNDSHDLDKASSHCSNLKY